MLHIFRVGRHVATDGNAYEFGEAAIRELAQSYDPALQEAPLVVGHPKTDDPAYGYARALTAVGGDLFAEPHQVEPQFADLVNNGRFKRISAAIYLPDAPGNPTPGKHYLRHIGFLGAAAPSLKGLRPASFAADDGALEFSAPLEGMGRTLVSLFQRLRDYFIARDGVDQGEQIIPQWAIADLDAMARMPDPIQSSEDTMTAPPAQFAEHEQRIATRTAEIDARERALAAREEQARSDDCVAFAATLVQSGQLLPRQQAPVVELLMVLPAATTVNFAEGDGQVSKPAVDVLRGLLAELPKQLDFAEKSAGGDTPATAEFAAPPGILVDQARLALHQQAIAYQRQHPGTDYAAAVCAVGGR
jgi:hypothetical protein